jgi:hypothetical protein
MKIGATAVEDLEYVKDLHLSDFAIFFELEMDDEDAELNQDMSVAIEKDISVLKTNTRYNFKVLDLAIQYLTVLVKNVQKINQEQEAQNLKPN